MASRSLFRPLTDLNKQQSKKISTISARKSPRYPRRWLWLGLARWLWLGLAGWLWLGMVWLVGFGLAGWLWFGLAWAQWTRSQWARGPGRALGPNGPGPNGPGARPGPNGPGPWAHGPIWAHMAPFSLILGPYGPNWSQIGLKIAKKLSLWGIPIGPVGDSYCPTPHPKSMKRGIHN